MKHNIDLLDHLTCPSLEEKSNKKHKSMREKNHLKSIILTCCNDMISLSYIMKKGVSFFIMYSL